MLAAFLRSFRDDPVRRNIVLLVNAGGILFGFAYYMPQFASTPPWLWPLVPDSPFAVLVASAALVLHGLGRGHEIVDALAFVYMAKVGLWTAFVLAFHPVHFSFGFLEPTMNTLLFYLHLGMAVEALVFLVDLTDLGWGWLPVGGWFLFNDWVDYGWTGYVDPRRTCHGLFPWTVPCDHIGLVAWVTVGLTVGLVGAAWAWTRLKGAAATGSAPRTG